MKIRALALCLAPLLASACGTATAPASASGSGGGGVTFSGSARALVTPSTLATPAFAGVHADVVGFEDLANSGANEVVTLASTSVQAAASSCMQAGCAFHVGGVSLSGVTQGLFVRLSAFTGTAAGQWQEAYTLVANSNQVQVSKQASGALGSFAPASLPSVATVSNLASLAGLSKADLLARGATLAYVSTSRADGDTWSKGESGAYVTLATAVAGSTVVYPDDSYQRVQKNGTNADGAVLIVGPPVDASKLARVAEAQSRAADANATVAGDANAAASQDGNAAVASTSAARDAAYAHAVNVAASGSGIVYVNNYVFFRPGALVLTTLLPQR